MRKKITVICIVAFVGFIIFQLIRVRIRASGEKIVEAGRSRVRIIELERRGVRKVLSYTGDIKGIHEALVYPDVPGILRQKLKKTGEKVKKDEPIVMVDRYEEALDYSMSQVKSPIAGRVLEIFQDEGARVTPGQPVARVGNVSSVEVRVEIPPNEAGSVAVGQAVEIKIDALPGKVFAGKVTETGAALQQLNRKMLVKAVVPNSRGLLRSGMLCDVSIIVKTILSAKAVPVQAVVEREGGKGVFVIDEENVARWVPTDIVLEGEEYIAVKGNINEKDRVVVEGNYGLLPDRVVEVLE